MHAECWRETIAVGGQLNSIDDDNIPRIEALVKHHKQSKVAHVILASLYTAKNDPRALNTLRAITMFEPLNFEIRLRIASYLRKRGMDQEASMEIQKAAKLLQAKIKEGLCDPSVAAELWQRLGVDSVNSEFEADVPRGMEYLRKALKINPKLASALHNQAYGYLRSGEPDKAIDVLQTVVRIDPRHKAANGALNSLLGQRAQHPDL